MSDVALIARDRGAALLDLGRAQDAEQELRQALSSAPDDPYTLGLLARCLFNQRQFDEARHYAHEAIRVEPEDPYGYYLAALASAALDDVKGATKMIVEAISRAPQYSAYRQLHAAILVQQRKFSEAETEAALARQLDPQSSSAATEHAWALFHCGRGGEAQAAVEEALRLDPEDDHAHKVAGMLQLSRGGGDEAIARYREALRLDPTDDYAREGLATALKTRNPVYGHLVQFDLWRARLPAAGRWAIIVSPFFASRALSAEKGTALYIPAMIGLVALVVIWWTLEPVMNLVLLASPDGRLVLGPTRKNSALIFAAFAAGAGATALVGVTFKNMLGVALGLALCSIAVGRAHEVRTRRRWFYGAVVLNAVSAVAAYIFAALGLGAFWVADIAVMSIGVVLVFYIWYGLGR